MKPRHISIALVSAALSSSSSGGEAVTDELGKRWLARSEAAARHLAQPDLDACDLALDRAFQHPVETQAGPFRHFELTAEVKGRALKAAYSYRGGSLASFLLISLPPQWFARQRANTKTLSILVGPANCAMDFCTDDPFVQGPCAGDTPE